MIPTAEEYILNNTTIITMAGNKEKVKNALIEFAKFHVEEALKAKIEAMREEYNYGGYSLNELDSFTKNAYPLENIK